MQHICHLLANHLAEVNVISGTECCQGAALSPLLGLCSLASGCDIKCLTVNEAQTVKLTTFSLNMSTNSSTVFSVFSLLYKS